MKDKYGNKLVDLFGGINEVRAWLCHQSTQIWVGGGGDFIMRDARFTHSRRLFYEAAHIYQHQFKGF